MSTTDPGIRNIVIAGGGTAGWMTAAAMARLLGTERYRITLIESSAIGTVGVGEATVPHLRFFNELLGIDEREFMRATSATFKLGIEFVDWGKIGDRYIHPFGVYGRPLYECGFLHSWLRGRALGDRSSLEDYAIGAVAARKGRFAYPALEESDLRSKYSYAFHIDANRYAAFLKDYSEARGVRHIDGRIEEVSCDSASGLIAALKLESGETVAGDFFIDCSGFRALLAEKTLGVEFEDWSRWLPCDRAVAIPSESVGEPPPFTRATASGAGWRWRIPLQHRTGNGHVYCSRYMDDTQACDELLAGLDGEPLAEPNFLRFRTGVRAQSWRKNCVAIGLSGGFLEPLESTSIYLIQVAIMHLIDLFPGERIAPAAVDEFNRLMRTEYERVRDFLILHYCASERDDTPFWNDCRNLSLPDSLQRKMDLFREQGQVEHYQKGMFLEPSWIAVYIGQNIVPQRWHPGADTPGAEALKRQLAALREEVAALAETLPAHASALQALDAAQGRPQAWPPAAMSLYGVFS
ncbi:tryptophan halogenase family protein [Microbulbifer halophilus]|uniref:Tryptophan halogenase family protein n=1 Tax=Microbulbifer halophilus TaxID=453963 RepID=A0ABW5EB28_9GAMM|nr:tryptophan halogenase family protein [Microbulbifer halophilus]MCW8125728.1 tryptophan 7-halogenase [Microbulbifer halophilus]